MIHASLFSGIGGPEVAAAMLGWENAFHCEINPFGRAVLEYWFPNSESYEDITKTNFTKWRGRIDVLTGGFPCQPFSYAGKRGGSRDDRYLWPEMLRVINEIRPAWVVGENVAGITTVVEEGVLSDMGCEATLFGEGNPVHRYEYRQPFTIERICKDLEAAGYSVQPVLIPAAAVGAPHRRYRIFIIACASNPSNTRFKDKRERPVTSDSDRHAAYTDSRRSGEIPVEIHSRESDGDEPLGPSCLRNASNSTNVGRGNTFNAGAEEEEICREMGGEGNCTQRVISITSDGIRRHVAYTEGEQYAESEFGESENKRPESWETGGSLGSSSEGLLPEYKWRYDESGDWIPTVPPIHRGNDGLPFSLDDLAISATKWRTESLKAYGNAIVPQVMLRIFQAIDSVENNQ